MESTLEWKDGGHLVHDFGSLATMEDSIIGFDPQGDFFTVDFGDKYADDGGYAHQGEEVKSFVEYLNNQKTNADDVGNRFPISLVAHSNGGLAARAFLVDHPVAAQDVAELVTYGTPHRGADVATVVETVDGVKDVIEAGLNAALIDLGLTFPLIYGFVTLDPFIDEYITPLVDSQGSVDSEFVGCTENNQPILSGLFLKDLNTKPLPSNVRYTSIIGHHHRKLVKAAPFGPISIFGHRPNDCHEKHWDGLVPRSSADLNTVGVTSKPVRTLETSEFHVGQGNDFTAILWALDPHSLSINVLSPVDIEVIAPDGRSLARQFTSIPGASYMEIDDEDGHTTTTVLIPFPLAGDYEIKVIPKPESSPTDMYSLTVTVGDTMTIIADDQQILDIPPEPFVVNVQRPCEIRTDYDPARCDHSSWEISPLADYLAYVNNDFGRDGGSKYKNLNITASLLSNDVLDIESPCSINVAKNVSLTGKFVSLDGLKGVFGKGNVSITAETACVLSGNGPASLGDRAQVDAEAMGVLAAETAMIGQHSTLNIGGPLRVTSIGDLRSSHAIIGDKSEVKAGSVTLSAMRSAIIRKLATVQADDAVTLRSTGDARDSGARLANQTRVFAQSLNLSSPLLTAIEKRAQVDVSGNLTMQSTGEGGHTHALIGSKADIKIGGEMALTSGAKATIGKQAKVNVSGNLQMEAGSAAQCTVSGSASVSFVSKSGICAPFLP